MGNFLFFVNIILSFLLSYLAFSYYVQICCFYVQVNESNVKVRTRSGRKYEFNTSDIEKVICTIESTMNMGSFFYITIIAKSKEFWMNAGWRGFMKWWDIFLKNMKTVRLTKWQYLRTVGMNYIDIRSCSSCFRRFSFSSSINYSFNYCDCSKLQQRVQAKHTKCY